MKRTVVITLGVLVAVAAAWSAYAYAQGDDLPQSSGPAACQTACEPAAQPCEKAQACHDGAACDPVDCPKFTDEDRDGKCDVAGDCGKAAVTTCPGHAETGCAGHVEGGHVGPRKSGCGTRGGSDTGCRRGRD